jgi:hypothetical protein
MSKVKQFTADEMARLYHLCRTRIPRDLCDTDDAVQYGLLVACEKHDPSKGSPIGLAFKAAYRYAWRQHTCGFKRWERTLCDVIDENNETTRNPEQHHRRFEQFFAVTDKSHVEHELDATLVDDIRRAVLAKQDWTTGNHKVGKSKRQQRRVLETLDLFAQSVIADAGPGIDEFENRRKRVPSKPYRGRNHATHRFLRQHFGIDQTQTSRIQRTLKECAAQALAERREHPDDYIEFQTESDETLAVLREQDERAMQ